MISRGKTSDEEDERAGREKRIPLTRIKEGRRFVVCGGKELYVFGGVLFLV